MRVDYRVGWRDFKSEWICFEHVGYARQKAVAWWNQRSQDPVPETAHQAVEYAKNGALAETVKITVRAVAGEPYQRIVGYEFGPIPEPLPAELLEFYEEEVPF
jgi:DNA repair protein RadD